MVILFDMFNMPEDIYQIVFATDQQRIVARILINQMKSRGGELNKTEMSFVANQLHEGKFITEIDEPAYKGKKVRLSYNKRQFYDRILTPLKSMGMVTYDLYKKTYKLSENFNKEMQKIGILWLHELHKDVHK